MAAESCVGIHKGHILCSFKYLDQSLVFIDLYDTAKFSGTVVYTEFYDLIERGIPYSFQDNKRAVDLA